MLFWRQETFLSAILPNEPDSFTHSNYPLVNFDLLTEACVESEMKLMGHFVNPLSITRSDLSGDFGETSTPVKIGSRLKYFPLVNNLL